MSVSTIGFALVVIAAFVGVWLSLMFAVNSNSRSRRLEITWEMSRPAKLAAEVADLAAVVDANKRATRAELGKIWQKFAKLEFVEPAGDAEQSIANLQAQVEHTSAVCENYIVAQNPANPGWRDARTCECNYCLTARAARAAEKASILAKQRKSARSNGSE